MTLEMPERMTAAEAKKVLGKFFKAPKPKKKSKYKNVKTKTDDGITHASKKQGMRWVLLRQWERDGKIRKLRREVPYRLEANGHLICKYVADHVYEEVEHDFCGVNVTLWTEVVEDVKSPITRKKRDYRIKYKLMKALKGIEIREV
jgi:hypothetical protein